MPQTEENCPCLTHEQPYHPTDKVRYLGMDDRFGKVTIKKCRLCNRLWLHYFVEYEHLRESGRTFMGLISPEQAETLTPNQAVPHLRSLPWHLYGGSYFFGNKGRSENNWIWVD